MIPKIHHLSERFTQNLRLLCATKPSVSFICREVGLNRQQFDRYLSGASLPSAHNLRRICHYFGVREQDLFGETARLREVVDAQSRPGPSHPLQGGLDPEAGELAILRNYVGLYFYYFLTPSWAGQVQCGLLDLRIENGAARTRYLARVRDPDFQRLFRSRFEGCATYRGDRLFILEYSSRVKDSFGQTILYPAHRHDSNYLSGMTFGIAWHPRRSPFASKVILKRVREATPLRDAVEACGLYPPDSRSFDPIIRGFFSEGAQPYMMTP